MRSTLKHKKPECRRSHAKNQLNGFITSRPGYLKSGQIIAALSIWPFQGRVKEGGTSLWVMKFLSIRLCAMDT
jgi:hypothetical protein